MGNTVLRQEKQAASRQQAEIEFARGNEACDRDRLVVRRCKARQFGRSQRNQPIGTVGIGLADVGGRQFAMDGAVFPLLDLPAAIGMDLTQRTTG